MKKLIGLIIIFLAQIAHADCADFGLEIFPKSKTLSSNPYFIITGFDRGQNVVKDLNLKFKIYLTDGEDTISIKILDTYRGRNLLQSVFKPSEKLKLKRFYRIVIEDVFLGSQPDVEGFGCKDFISHTFEIISSLPKSAITNKINIEGRSFVQYGCGPSSHVVFSVESDLFEYMVKTKLTNVENGSVQIFYLSPFENKLYVGNGMCSGEFGVIPNKEYLIEFELFDLDGNLFPTVPLKFVSDSLAQLPNHP